MNLLFILLSGVVGLVLGILVMFGISKAGLNKDQQKAARYWNRPTSRRMRRSNRRFWTAGPRCMN